MGLNGFIFKKINENENIKEKKILGAQFGWKLAWLAVLFSRQILNGSQDFFFLFNILIFIYFFKYETIETYARAFLTLNILAIGRVNALKFRF